MPQQRIKAERLPNNPLIRPNMDDRMSENVNGPSLVRTPEWLPGRRGRFHLYFAHHRGTYIRMACSDDLAGPWQTHEPGVLDLEDTPFEHHIASPDMHVDEANRRIVMYFHGRRPGIGSTQETRVAISTDGLTFRVLPEVLGCPYLRVFRHGGVHYGIAMPSVLYRSKDGLTGFIPGPEVIGEYSRHVAVLVRGERAYVFYSRIGDSPERIVCAAMDLRGDWREWRCDSPVEVLHPETEWEGAGLSVVASERGPVDVPVAQLRDPAVFEDVDGQAYLLYSVAGERGIAIARLTVE